MCIIVYMWYMLIVWINQRIGLIPNFYDINCACFWCYPRHLKKHIKLITVNISQNKANPIQNKLIVKTLTIKIIAQNNKANNCEIQNMVTLKECGTRAGFLD